jgi:hypothetical protein
MSYDQLSRGYEPRDPFQQYHGQPEAEQQRQKSIGLGQYAHNMAQQQERFHPGAALGAEVKQRQQGSVTREIQQLEKNLHALASVIDALDNRLAYACLPVPETASGLRTSDGGGCALANQLAAFNSMLSTQSSRLEMIYQGVDL